MPLYIEKINGDVDRPTNQPTDQPTDQPGEYRAICLFRKLENRKMAEICNSSSPPDPGMSPGAHTGDGATDLILVRKTHHVNYLRYLVRWGVDIIPFALSFFS